MANDLIKWLMDCPCVVDKRVRIDVRGPWPTAYIGFIAAKIESREDFIKFVDENLK